MDDLAIGDAHFRDVAFLILPDSQEPMTDLPPAECGLIGIEVPIALRSIAWNSDGTFEFGREVGRANSDKNLSFDQLYLVVRGQFEGKAFDYHGRWLERAGNDNAPGNHITPVSSSSSRAKSGTCFNISGFHAIGHLAR